MRQILCLILAFWVGGCGFVVSQEKPKRENIEWLDVWMPETNNSGLPRVLLIGNSITRQYHKDVENQLKGKAFVARLATSKSLGDPGLLQEIALVMGYHQYDVVHFNNGMHGWDYSEQEYAAALPGLLKTIRECAPDAKLIWANTTPIRNGERIESFDLRNARIIERNRIAADFFKGTSVRINDLYSLLASNTAFYGGKDGIHPLPSGVKVLADRISGEIGEALGETPDLINFPDGFTPEEVGKKLGYRFLPGKHFLHGGKWIHYAEVCTWYGALRYAQATCDRELIAQLQERFEPLFTTERAYLPTMDHVDLNMFGCLPLEFFKVTQNRRYYDLGIPYADTQWQLPPDATKEQKNWAKNNLSWQTRMWIDDMFMITIIQKQAWEVTGERRYIDRAAREMVTYLDQLQRPNGLFYHAPDVPFFWGRGNGWMAAGMTELLLSIPEGNPDRFRILESYRSMMARLKEYQSASGMWNQLIDKPDCWPETSSTAMFAYAMITGVKNGWLDAREYGPSARRAWMALVSYIDENGDVREVCEGTNKKNDERYYYDRARITGDYHGQAPILWCATALLK